MAKHNRKWYDNRIHEAQVELEAIRARIENTDWDNIPDGTDPNAIYDEEYAAEQKIRSLERERDTRNWTSADWASYDLVTSNID